MKVTFGDTEDKHSRGRRRGTNDRAGLCFRNGIASAVYSDSDCRLCEIQAEGAHNTANNSRGNGGDCCYIPDLFLFL